jgi:hypothetical protein
MMRRRRLRKRANDAACRRIAASECAQAFPLVVDHDDVVGTAHARAVAAQHRAPLFERYVARCIAWRCLLMLSVLVAGLKLHRADAIAAAAEKDGTLPQKLADSGKAKVRTH